MSGVPLPTLPEPLILKRVSFASANVFNYFLRNQLYFDVKVHVSFGQSRQRIETHNGHRLVLAAASAKLARLIRQCDPRGRCEVFIEAPPGAYGLWSTYIYSGEILIPRAQFNDFWALYEYLETTIDPLTQQINGYVNVSSDSEEEGDPVVVAAPPSPRRPTGVPVVENADDVDRQIEEISNQLRIESYWSEATTSPPPSSSQSATSSSSAFPSVVFGAEAFPHPVAAEEVVATPWLATTSSQSAAAQISTGATAAGAESRRERLSDRPDPPHQLPPAQFEALFQSPSFPPLRTAPLPYGPDERPSPGTSCPNPSIFCYAIPPEWRTYQQTAANRPHSLPEDWAYFKHGSAPCLTRYTCPRVHLTWTGRPDKCVSQKEDIGVLLPPDARTRDPQRISAIRQPPASLRRVHLYFKRQLFPRYHHSSTVTPRELRNE